jgi:hypothetical protein
MFLVVVDEKFTSGVVENITEELTIVRFRCG